MNTARVRISELAQAAGLSAYTIRFYEREGILPQPERSRSGVRQDRSDAVMLLRCIAMLRRLGMSLEDLRALMHAIADAGGCAIDGTVQSPPEVREKFAERLRVHHEQLLADREELDRVIGFTEQLLHSLVDERCIDAIQGQKLTVATTVSL